MTAAVLLMAAAAHAAQPAQNSAEPILLIIETDMGNDIDDALSIMAGNYGNKEHSEYNVIYDIPAMQQLEYIVRTIPQY